MKIFTLILLQTLVFSVFAQKVRDKIITIDPHMSFQNYEHFKRLTLDSPDSYVEYVEGFEFEWGYTYKLLLKETELEQWLSDGTRYEYKFEKVVSKAKMPDSSRFLLTLDGNRYYYEVDSSEIELNKTIQPINDSVFLYFEKVEIEVPNALMEQFLKIADGKLKKRGEFSYVDPKRIRLVGFK